MRACGDAEFQRHHQRWLDEHRKSDQASREKPFARFVTDRVRTDHGFVAKHPLLPAAKFRTEDLVGNAKTFFGTSSGKKPEKRIGADPKGKASGTTKRKPRGGS